MFDDLDAALKSMQVFKWKQDYWARRDEQIRLERERADREHLAQFLDPNSDLVREAYDRARSRR